jgi:hypothetical protein
MRLIFRKLDGDIVWQHKCGSISSMKHMMALSCSGPDAP